LAMESIVHRDIALRNILLTGNHIVKIADFGMSRRVNTLYKRRLSCGEALPIRWMALEALLSGEYSQKSDVWSFGILLWELFTCGKLPYANLEDANEFASLVAWLKNGNRLEEPLLASKEMYALMMNCWDKHPGNRPTFSECKRQISAHLERTSPTIFVTVKKKLCDAWFSLEKPQPLESQPEVLPEIDMAEQKPEPQVEEEESIKVQKIEYVQDVWDPERQPYPYVNPSQAWINSNKKTPSDPNH